MQKLKDFAQVIQASKGAKIALVLGAIAVGTLIFTGGEPPLPRTFRQQQQKKPDSTGAIEAKNDIYDALRAKMDKIQDQSENTNRKILELTERNKEMESQTADILKKMLSRMSELQANGNGGLPTPLDVNSPDQGLAVESGPDGVPSRPKQQEMEEFLPSEKEVAPPIVPQAKKVAFVGAGDSVRVKLLAGVNAPTDGTPYPVVFQLLSDVHGPDGSVLPLGEARVIAAAQGSLTDSRALFRLTKLNLSLPSGERKVLDVDGWIVGEDGIRGMAGILIDPIGKAIGGAGMAGAVSGLGQAAQMANSQTFQNANGGLSTIVTGNRAEFAAGTALSGAANQWSNIIQNRLQQLVPVVKVYSGREATAVFANNLNIEGLMEALDEQGESDPSLD